MQLCSQLTIHSYHNSQKTIRFNIRKRFKENGKCQIKDMKKGDEADVSDSVFFLHKAFC